MKERTFPINHGNLISKKKMFYPTYLSKEYPNNTSNLHVLNGQCRTHDFFIVLSFFFYTMSLSFVRSSTFSIRLVPNMKGERGLPKFHETVYN